MLGKLADTCVVHLTPDIISLAVSSTASSGVQVWADVPQRAHFLEYRIESRAEGNRITFFATVENLQRALKWPNQRPLWPYPLGARVVRLHHRRVDANRLRQVDLHVLLAAAHL